MSDNPALSLPPRFKDTAFLDVSSGTVHADQRTQLSPYFRSWVEENLALGHSIQVVRTDLDVIAQIRTAGVTGARAGESDDMAVRESALLLIKDAAALRVTDVHFIRRQDFMEVQFRSDGRLLTAERMSPEQGDRLIRSIYQGIATSRDAQFEHGTFQNAQISGDILAGTGMTSIRVVRGPCHPIAEGGNFATLRLQYADTHNKGALKEGHRSRRVLTRPRHPDGELRLGQMGYSPRQVERLMHMVSAPEGGILLTGPTGSGKTTTIYEGMAHLARRYPGKRQVTIEDPIEYPMPWAVQLDVRNANDAKASGAAFAERLRVALRMDPDIVLVGEVREAEVAQSFINAALTGHLVLSTLHVADPFQFVERLESMDKMRLNPRSFCDPNIIRGVVGQRLVPLLCQDCCLPLAERPEAIDPLTLAALKTYGPTDDLKVVGTGCAKCRQSGTRGRRAVAEVIVCDDELMSDFVNHGTAEARRRYRKRPDADPAMVEAAILLALQGLVDPADVSGSVQHISPKTRSS